MKEIRSLWIIPNIHSQVITTIADDEPFELDDAFELRKVCEKQKYYQCVDVYDEIEYFKFQELF